MSKDNLEFTDNSSVEIMNYLINKLESNYSSIIKFNSLIDSFDSSESFFTLKKDLKLLFNDLLQSFKQGIFAIKALTNQNKKILEEMKLKDIENKRIIEQFNNQITENKSLKKQIIKIKDKDIADNLEKNEDYKIINKNKEINNNNNNNNNNYSNNNYCNNNYNNKYEFAQLSNVKNIMNNIKKNKMKLKMAFENFSNNQEQDINDNYNDNNNDDIDNY